MGNPGGFNVKNFCVRASRRTGPSIAPSLPLPYTAAACDLVVIVGVTLIAAVGRNVLPMFSPSATFPRMSALRESSSYAAGWRPW